jgi:hypothetical protein
MLVTSLAGGSREFWSSVDWVLVLCRGPGRLAARAACGSAVGAKRRNWVVGWTGHALQGTAVAPSVDSPAGRTPIPCVYSPAQYWHCWYRVKGSGGSGGRLFRVMGSWCG